MKNINNKTQADEGTNKMFSAIQTLMEYFNTSYINYEYLGEDVIKLTNSLSDTDEEKRE